MICQRDLAGARRVVASWNIDADDWRFGVWRGSRMRDTGQKRKFYELVIRNATKRKRASMNREAKEIALEKFDTTTP